jgi:hypothetical protein
MDETVETGKAYATGEPVTVRLRSRGVRVQVDDGGAGVRAGGAPSGWLPVAERAVDEFALNVNRAGVVFVQARADRDIGELSRRVAEASHAVHAELLELE